MNDFMGIEMGLPNFNFQKLPKNFINMNNANQIRKGSQDSFSMKYKDKFINESLLNFSKSEKNNLLEELVNNIINFRKKCINKDENINKIRNSIISNYLFFHNIEKNLIEISYLSQKEHRDEKIKILYKWYKNILNRNSMLKRIKSKSFISVNEKYDLTDLINDDENKNNNEEMKSNKEDTKNNKEIINKYIEKEIIKEEKNEEQPILKKENKENILAKFLLKEKNNKKSESSSREHRLFLSSAKNQFSDILINSKSNLSWNFMTRLHIKKNCANKHNIPRTNSEIISSSFIRTLQLNKDISFPIIEDKHFKIEEDIMNSKLRLLSEKRNLEDVNINLNKFGMSRAKFKENINNKYEIKELIKMYVNENKNENDINNSRLLKKYLNKKIDSNKTNNTNLISIKNNFNKIPNKKKETLLKKNINKRKGNNNSKKRRIFYGINHIKIFLNKIKNINKDNKKINDNEINNIKTFNIRMKICGNDIKMCNLISKSSGDKSTLIKETSNQLISNDFLFKEKIKNHNLSYDLIKKEDIYKSDLNYSSENGNLSESEEEKLDNKNEQKESEYFDEDFYNKLLEEEEKKKHYNLSLFHINNFKKIPLNKKKNIYSNILRKFRFKSNDLSEKKKLGIINLFIKNKSDFLSIRKNMEILNKFDYKQINDKNSNIFFHHCYRFDNIDEDDKIKSSDIQEQIHKKGDNKLQKRFCLSKALFEPKSNNSFCSIYYLPRPGSKLLIRK